jgi:integrase
MRLVRKPDTWELRVFVGRDAKGRVRHQYATVNGSRRFAERALARLVEEVQAETVARVMAEDRGVGSLWGPHTTINDAIAAWRLNGWQDLSPSTTKRYESIWSVQVRDSIGEQTIVSLSSYDLERYFRKLKDGGLSEASVRQVRAVLNRSCRLARKWSGNVLPNPVADSELPSWALDSRSDVRSPSIDEVLQLLEAAGRDESRIGVLVRLVTATGMRRGEACAIRWSDVEWDASTVLVDKSVIAVDDGTTGTIVKPPKTRASIRTVVVDVETLEQLRALRSEQENLAKSCDRELDPRGFVFSFEPAGESPPHPDAISHGFIRIRKRAGLPSNLHLHSLRHFQATVLDAVISERQKQARMGWSTVQMARHYTAAVHEEDRRAAEHVGRILAGKEEPQDGQ